MWRKQVSVVLGAGVAVCGLALGMALFSSPQSLVLTVREFRVDNLSPLNMIGTQQGRELVFAVIEASNASPRTLNCIVHGGHGAQAHGNFYFAQSKLFTPDAAGLWREQPRRARPACSSSIFLGPEDTFKFPAVIDSDAPCRVGFEYSFQRWTNGLWQQWPAWLTRRLPFQRSQQLARTSVIQAPAKIIEVARDRRVAAETNRANEEADLARRRGQALLKAWHPPVVPLESPALQRAAVPWAVPQRDTALIP